MKNDELYSLYPIDNPSIKDLLAKYETQRSLPLKMGFNPFRLMSDVYHRENFHSDIIAALLDPGESHGSGDAFLSLFIEWINSEMNQGVGLNKINTSNFADAKVERENHRIDITIYDKKSMQAIIIENKINYAPDMEQQIPRYVKSAEERSLKVVAIVYLTLNELKNPDMSGWDYKDKEKISPLLISAAAFRHDEPSMLSGWLNKCQLKTSDFNTLSVIRQYSDLITTLGSTAMNGPLMQDLLTYFSKNDGEFKKARAFVKLMSDLQKIRRDKIIDHFKDKKHHPFDEVTKVKDTSACFIFNGWKGITLEIVCREEDYELLIFDRSAGRNTHSTRLHDLLNENIIPDQDQYEYKDDGCYFFRDYAFPQDRDAIMRDLENILTALKKCQDENKFDLK